MLFQFTPNTKIQSAQENANWNNFSNHGRNFTIKWPFGGSLFTQTSNDIASLPDNATIDRIDLIAQTAPTGAAIIVDILKSQNNGVTFSSIFTVGPGTNRPQIVDGAYVGNTITIDVNTMVKFTDFFKPQIVQVGSSQTGADLAVMLRGTYNLD